MSRINSNKNSWPETNNLRLILKNKPLHRLKHLVEQDVIISEKMHGQNISIPYDPINDKFLNFRSRKSILENELLNGQNISFMNKYKPFVKKLWEIWKHEMTSSNNKIIEFKVFGELHLGDDNNHSLSYNIFKYGSPSWYAFGIILKFSDGKPKIYYLTKDLVELFEKVNLPHPKILFEGNIIDGLEKLNDDMINGKMEGVVITKAKQNNENITGKILKYKIPYFEACPLSYLGFEKPVKDWTDKELAKKFGECPKLHKMLKLVDNMFLKKFDKEYIKNLKIKRHNTKSKIKNSTLDKLIKSAKSNVSIESELSKIDLTKYHDEMITNKKLFVSIIKKISASIANDVVEEYKTICLTNEELQNLGIIKNKVAGAIFSSVKKYIESNFLK